LNMDKAAIQADPQGILVTENAGPDSSGEGLRVVFSNCSGPPRKQRGIYAKAIACSKNKTTLLATSLAGEQGEEILRKAIEMAKGGNVPMMKFLLDRIPT
jgi:hypothetical protein